jgi:hypothetical protein
MYRDLWWPSGIRADPKEDGSEVLIPWQLADLARLFLRNQISCGW